MIRRPDYFNTLVALNVAVGTCYLLQSPNRETSDAYHYAKGVTGWLPWINAMRWWGVIFLIGALAVWASQRKPRTTRIAACFGLGIWIWWAVLLASAALFDGRSGFVGPVLFVAGAVRHYQVTDAHLIRSSRGLISRARLER